MIKFLKRIAIILLTIIFLLSILLCFAIDNSPQPVVNQGLNRDDIQRAKQLLHVTPEERNRIKTISLNSKDLNIAVSYLINHYIESTTAIRIDPDRIAFQIAIFVPKSLWGRYLDFSFNIRQNQNGIYLKSLKIGEISIPDKAANWLIAFIVHNTVLNDYWQLAREYIKDVQITPQSLDISYLGSLVEQTKQLAIKKHKDYPSLHIYQQQINDIINIHDPDWRLSIMELLNPLFTTAFQRSDESTAINENRAVIIAVASYVFKGELRRYLPIGLIYNKEYPVFAYKRIDIPQHFIAAALLAAVDSTVLTQQLSVDKEVGDAQHGSGFSFIDLLADKAGIRFGQMATASPEQARKLQQLLANNKDYASIIPNVQDLPEHMDEDTFKQRYSEVGSPAYQAIIEQIEARIRELAIYN
ncbi:MAG: hypothetical protein ACKN9F_05790 [Methylomonas sp.]